MVNALKFRSILLWLVMLSVLRPDFAISQIEDLKNQIPTFNKTIKETGTLPQKDYCPDCNTFANEELTSVRHSLKNPAEIKVSVISQERAKDLFKQLAANEDVPHRFIMEGCFARAHIMGKQLDEMGLTPAKAYVEGDLSMDGGEFGPLRWQYHVAPMIIVKTKSGNVPYVFDPALFKKPVPFSEWKALLLKNSKSKFSGEYFTSRFIYNPDTRHDQLTSYDEEDLEHAVKTNREHSRIVEMMDMETKILSKNKKGKK